MKLTWTRSQSWLRAQAISRCADVPETATQDITDMLPSLSEETRGRLLSRNEGAYLSRVSCAYVEYAVSDTPQYVDQPYWSSYSIRKIEADADTMTAPEVESILRAAWNACVEVVEESKRQIAEAKARAAAEATKREAREKAVNDARELLRDEIASLTERAETAEADRAILGEFLREVPDDAKRGTIRACVAADAGESEKGYAEKLEKASPDVWLFSDDKEDDSDESDE